MLALSVKYLLFLDDGEEQEIGNSKVQCSHKGKTDDSMFSYLFFKVVVSREVKLQRSWL